MSERPEQQRRAEAHQNDADVLDAVVGQQPLEVVLHQRIEDAQQPGNHTDHQHHHAGPHRNGSIEIEEHTRHPVDSGLDEDPRHQRGDVAGRHRMRRGQPDVHRNDARLDAETEEQQKERDRAQRWGKLLADPVQRGKIQAARGRGEHQESDQQHSRAAARHQEVQQSGFPGLRGFMIEDHQEIRGHRRQLPDDQKEQNVRRREDQGQGKQKQIQQGAEHTRALANGRAGDVTDGIHRDRSRQQREGQVEVGRKRIETDRVAQIRYRGGQRPAQFRMGE